MRVLIINPILYTSESKCITRATTIKDTMIYDLCLAFHELGHYVTLYAAEPFKPDNEEWYPFEVLWGKCILPAIFMPHCFPVMPEIYKYICNHKSFDLIITSEVFSINSYLAVKAEPQKVIIWHELAKHNAMMKTIPSRLWYGFVARYLMKEGRVVARSEAARCFIKQYCRNVDRDYIDHGVNLQKFAISTVKDNSFLVCSQLIARKRIDGTIRSFAAYLKTYDPTARLFIAGQGEEENNLRALVSELGISSNVIMCGKLSHDELTELMPKMKALLINTIKDNSMISIVEAIACGIPVVTTDVPLNSEYIQKYDLGIAKFQWNEDDLHSIIVRNDYYSGNCKEYRKYLSTNYRVEQFLRKISN